MTEINAKLLGLPETLNDDLLSRAIAHQIQIQRYGEGVSNQIVELLEQSEADLVKKLRNRLDKIEARGFDLGPATTQRVRNLIVGTGEIVDNRYSKVYGTLKDEMVELAQSEAKYQIGEIEDAVGVTLEMELPAANQLRSIVTAQPFEGAVMSQWAKKLAASEKESIGQAVRLGLAQGETTEQIVQGLTSKGGGIFKSKANARAYTRTAVNHVSTHARVAVHQENSSLIKGEQMIATLDGRTTPICRFQDGKIYPVGEGPRPPFHYNCRTTVVPVLKSWKEIGIDADELPASTRASMNGQVPATVTYKDWFVKQPAAFQREVLGPNRYKMYKAGLEDVTRYSNRAGALYTLDELYKKHPNIAAKAGLIDTDELTGITKAAATDKLNKHLDSISLTPPANLTLWKPFKEQLTAVLDTAKGNVASAQRANVSATKIADYMAEVDNKVTAASKALEGKLLELSAADLKEISKTGKLKLWQWTNKQEMATKLSSINAQELQEVNESVRAKHAAWKAQQKINKQQKEAAAAAKKAEQEAQQAIKDEVTEWDTLTAQVVNDQDPADWKKTKAVLSGATQEAMDQVSDLNAVGIQDEALSLTKGATDAIKSKQLQLEQYYQDYTLSQLQALGKGGGIPKWQWGSKDELYKIVTSNNKAQLDLIDISITSKWKKYKQNLKAASEKKKLQNELIKAKAELLQEKVKLNGGKILLKDAKALVKDADNVDASTLSPAVSKALDDLNYKTKPANTPQAPTVAPQAAQDVTEVNAAPAQPLKPVSEQASSSAVDDIWNQGVKFKLIGDARQLGGAHAKMFYSDADGNKWLFKPAKSNSVGWIAHGEEFVYKIQRTLDPKTPEVRWINLDGQQGSIQRVIDDVEGDFAGIDPTDLSPDDLIAIQREHVLDWLTANHDGHWKQFLRDKSGHIYGIDKGQAFKHFGDDALDIKYHPNAVYGETEPYYNSIWRAFKEGKKVEVDPQNSLPFIKQIESISEEEFKKALKPYADGRFGKGSAEAKMFIEGVLERKRNIRKDFERFYSDLTGSDFAFIDDVAARAAREAAAEGESYVSARLTAREVAVVEEDVIKSGSQGKSIDFDGDMVEDQNLWIQAEQVGKETHTNAILKLREDEAEPFLSWLKGQDIEGGYSAVETALRVPGDDFYEPILAGIKTFKVHTSDLKFNQATLKKAFDLEKTLKAKNKAAAAGSDLKNMTSAYLKALKILKEALNKDLDAFTTPDKIKKLLDLDFQPFQRTVVADKAAKKSSVKVRRGESTAYKREALDDGTIKRVGDRQTLSSLMPKVYNDSTMYYIDFDDGLKMVFEPFDSDFVARRGRIEITLPEAPSTQALERIMDKLEEIGVDSRVATPEDNELLYLIKQGFAAKKENDTVYTNLLRELDGQAASKATRIRRLKEYWNNELGVDDVSQLPEYQPEGKYELSFKAYQEGKTEFSGRRQYYRFDWTDQQVEKRAIRHSTGDIYVQYDNHLVSLFRDSGFLKKNSRLSTTLDKPDLGVYAVGDTPEPDLRSGGGSYLFTRVFDKTSKGGSGTVTGIYFKSRNLRRMDSIKYNADKFGTISDFDERAGSFEDYGKFKRISNETNFKNGLEFIDEIDKIVCKTEKTRKIIIKAFKDANIKKLPDGRKVEDIVIKGGEEIKPK